MGLLGVIMAWGSEPPKPMWARIREERDPLLTEDVATLQADMQAAQQAIRQMKRTIDLLRMISGLSIGGIGILALAVGVLSWWMR